jgi:SAM-dependent methyltransferase
MEKTFMINTSKICDAADWFDPEIKYVIENELKESARLHRKQWEFAMIFLTLKKMGLLKENSVGLSVGGGNERVLYSIAQYIKKLFVTDLYDDNTSWDCARTQDPDEFIKASKPFPVDDNKIQALKMDMRFLEFDDNSFDFCYSSCAIEHIGEQKDFIQHFNEVNRVLKDGGIYVLTTELQFGEQTIPDPNNYIFSKKYLADLISESDLEPVSDVNVELSKNEINYPFPSNIKNALFHGHNFINEKIFGHFPHTILLRGNVPFTSVLLILKKSSKAKKSEVINFLNYDRTKKFLLEGVENYRRFIGENKISISPFSSLPNGVSRFFLDHSEYFSNDNILNKSDETIFHSDYFWLGNGKRMVEINFKVNELLPEEASVIQLRIHSYSTYASSKVNCIFEKDITVSQNMIVNEIIELNTNENSNYAFLCNLISGNISCSSISIESWAIKEEQSNFFVKVKSEGVSIV